jgi:LacI family transcriptional regulator
VLHVVPLSRRMLEHRFVKLVGRTPHAEIIRIRMERASRLLRETSLSLTEIANRAGFADANYLSVAFKRQMGVAPRTYRAEMRRTGGQRVASTARFK